MKISGYAMMLCASVSALSLSLASQANAQSAQPDQNDLSEVVVTGSRIVRNGNNAPTPVTVATTEEMALLTPTNLPDALNKLPAFSGSRNSGTTGASGNPNTGNYLNLRAFGTTRVLILLDGQRVPPTHFDGSVNIDTLPQMLVQRVDVVTGGASAVYGSDAVTGVVNFILDKHFVGLKGEAQGGVSQQNDDGSWKVGAAYGASVLDGRGHFIASAAHFQRKGIPSKFDRPYGEHAYQEAGTGTAANPFHIIDNGRISSVSFGGLILQGPNPTAGSLQAGTLPGTLPTALRSMQFLPDGSIAPFNAGTPSGNANLASGGDGGWLRGNAITASQNNNQLFARFEYEFTPDVTGFVQGTWAASRNAYHGQNLSRTVGSSNGINVYSCNAFLPASVQSALTAGNVAWFGLGRYEDEFGNAILIDALNTTEAAVAGLNGKLGTWNWETYYSYGEGRIHARQPNNIYNPNYYAAIDAVKDASGNIVCRVTLTNPSAYPGCVPMNIFGAGRPSAASIAYVLRTSEWQAVSTQQDFAANISGSPFNTWAGEVQVAGGIEYRSLDLVETSNSDPNEPFNKTGWDKQTDLRGPFTAATQNWTRGALAPTAGSMKVKEANVEAILPLLNNAPFAKNLELNGAYRYTKYDRTGLGVSTGVSAKTWKLGVNWRPLNDLRFRATRSDDIRAPSLIELFAGKSAGTTGFTDLHTGFAGFTANSSQGNPNLVPEVAHTTTVGGVWTPSFLSGFSASVDYYKIEIANAIASVGGNTTAAQNICEASGGTSPLCALYIRPLPFSNTTPANYPTLILSQNVNIAETSTHGVDVELGYRSMLQSLPGAVDLRLLYSYQPELLQKTLPNATVINLAGAASIGPGSVAPQKKRLTLSASYALEPFTVNAQVRYLSSLRPNGDPTLVYSDPDIPAITYVDLGATLDVKTWGHSSTLFLTVQNAFDKDPPLYASAAFTGNPGFYYPVPTGYDLVGRYFTMGLRFKF